MILCNSVELIRERLTISEDGPSVGPREEQKDDYVYDIYYLETATPGWIENILSVQPLSQEWELVRGPMGMRQPKPFSSQGTLPPWILILVNIVLSSFCSYLKGKIYPKCLLGTWFYCREFWESIIFALNESFTKFVNLCCCF